MHIMLVYFSSREACVSSLGLFDVPVVVAGRLGPGKCYRMWTEAQDRSLQEEATPEILGADLAPLALQLASWQENQPVFIPHHD